jgi:hypothetical protein
VKRASVRWLLAWLAAGVIAAAGVRSASVTLESADAAHNWSRPPADLVSQREFALAPLKPLLVGQREVGYATVVPNDRVLHPEAEAVMERYFVAQYVLSPTRLSLRAGLPLMLADFPTGQELDRFLRKRDATVRWRSGGVALVEMR